MSVCFCLIFSLSKFKFKKIYFFLLQQICSKKIFLQIFFSNFVLNLFLQFVSFLFILYGKLFRLVGNYFARWEKYLYI